MSRLLTMNLTRGAGPGKMAILLGGEDVSEGTFYARPARRALVSSRQTRYISTPSAAATVCVSLSFFVDVLQYLLKCQCVISCHDECI